jgi:hypothetical protein
MFHAICRSEEGSTGRPSAGFSRMSSMGLPSINQQQQQQWGLPNMSELRRMGTELFATGWRASLLNPHQLI